MPCEPQPANKPLARASGFTDGGFTSPTHGKEARQQKQRVWGDSSSVLPFWGGLWRPVAFVAVRPPVLFPCAGGQRGCRGVAHPKILGCTPPGHGDGAGGAETGPATFLDPGGKDHGAQRSGPRPGNEVFAPGDKTGTRQCLVAVTGIRLQCVSTPTGHQGRWHNTLSASSATRVWRAEPVIRAGIVEGGFDLE